MKLRKVAIKRFRNILNVEDLAIQDDVTCLVGKNQSGKTAVLHALLRCRPGRPAKQFELLKDYPAWREKADKRKGEDLSQIEPCLLTFALEESDKAHIRQQLGCYPLASDEVTFARNYGNEERFEVQANEATLVNHLIVSKGATDAVVRALGAERTIESVKAALAATIAAEQQGSELRSEAEAFSTAFNAVVGDKTAADIIEDAVSERLPLCFYFDEYSELQYSTNIAKVLSQADNTLSDSELTVRSLLRLAGADESYIKGAEYETRKREIENVSNDLTITMRQYWTQNTELAAAPDVTADIQTIDKKQVVVPQDLKLRIRDDRHFLSLPIDQHSAGFRWFFSFLAAFSEYENTNPPPIVLLDEPALNLHARAQKDFLRLIRDRLAARCQVIFTTHSPFMVEPDKLENVRIVEDRGIEAGAVVSAEIFSTDPDTLFPLQGALGYGLAQHLMIGPNNLLVEGSADLVYLEALSSHLEEQRRPVLDPRFSIVVAGGAELMPAFVSLLGTDLDLTVLIDGRRNGHQRLERLVEHRVLEQRRIVAVGQVINKVNADIEDLFTVDDYLLLVNGAFGTALQATALGNNADRMVRRVARAMNVDDYNHGKPADYLLRNKATLLPRLSAATLTNFENLFRALNATLPRI